MSMKKEPCLHLKVSNQEKNGTSNPREFQIPSII